MGETHTDETAQTNASLDDYDYLPATVCEHESHSDGVTLVTIDPDPDSNIEVYNDDRPAHRSGNPPEV